jgi:hypothetical protein
MLKNHILVLCSIFLIAGIVFPLVRVGNAQTTTVYVDPAQVTGLQIGDSFSIDVTVTEVTDLAGWEFQLFYNPQVLNATGATEGPFLKNVQSTFFLIPGMDDNYNSTHGRVYVACTTLPVVGVSGSGVLASVSFKIVGAGQSVLALPLETTKLLDNTPGRPQPIPHTTTGGLVSVVGADIAITDIKLSKTITADPQMAVNVTAANQGNFTASFNVTLYYDTNEISTQTVTNLAPATSTLLTFLWNLTQVPKGNYTISAYAPPIVGENNVDNNQLVDGWVQKTITGDLNGDGKVNIVDVTIVARAFQARPGDPSWNPNADMDNNGVINIVDVTKVAKEFGKTDP